MNHILRKIKLKNFIMLTLAGCVNAFGITVFLAPVSLYDSGISGTSMFLDQLIAPIPLSVFLIALNIPLFIYGLKRQGGVFTVYAIYTVAIYSIAAFIITDVLPIDVSSSSPIAGSDLLLCSIFGGLVSGVGSGMAIRYGGAMDGIEVMAIIFSKRIGVSVGTFVMSYNALLYIVCGIVVNSWALPLYSIIAYAVGSKTVDFIVEGFDRSKSAMIITTRPNDICAALTDTFESGTTKIQAIGGYSNLPKTVIYFVVNRFQIARMKDIVHEIDPQAYITISEVADVFSNNQRQ